MQVGDLAIVINSGELKLYRANPRDLEAEAGLKPENIKLDLINTYDYIEGHQKIKDVVTDSAGRFRSDASPHTGIAEKNGIEQKLEDDTIRQIAEDIERIISEYKPKRYFLAMPGNIFKRVWDRTKELSAKNPDLTNKLFRYIEDDLVKVDKNKLPEVFKEKGQHF